LRQEKRMAYEKKASLTHKLREKEREEKRSTHSQGREKRGGRKGKSLEGDWASQLHAGRLEKIGGGESRKGTLL